MTRSISRAYSLIEEEWHEMEEAFSPLPCPSGPSSLLCGIWAKPRIFRVLPYFLTGPNFNLRPGFANCLLKIAESPPQMWLGRHDPQIGESVPLRPLDSSSGDAQSRGRIAGFLGGVFHRDTLFDTNVELGIYRRIEFPRLFRRDLGNASIRFYFRRHSRRKRPI